MTRPGSYTVWTYLRRNSEAPQIMMARASKTGTGNGALMRTIRYGHTGPIEAAIDPRLIRVWRLCAVDGNLVLRRHSADNRPRYFTERLRQTARATAIRTVSITAAWYCRCSGALSKVHWANKLSRPSAGFGAPSAGE